MTRLYVYGLNYNPLEDKEESYITEIKIPAGSHAEANSKLLKLVGNEIAGKCYLDNIEGYEKK